ncbi:MAG: site-specific integrase [Planctomycetaceae bacterium]|nr:site-specific integrase [Planctomycetaceae bacterium]
MPRPKSAVPRLYLHKPSGRVRVRIDGREVWLGKQGSPEAEEAYRRVVAEYLTTGSAPPRETRPGQGPVVAELIVAYWAFAKAYYVKDGRPTSEVHILRGTLRLLREHYGSTTAADFGPLRLKALREVMVTKDWCRGSVNARISRIKRLFKWGVENELIPASVHHGLSAVAGLRQGRTEAKESAPVLPADEADVNAILPHVSRQVKDMIRIQCYTGMRPGEVCALRPSDVNRDGEVWEYRPPSHKTQHHGRERVVFIGPKAQAILAPYIDNRPAAAYCFSPAEAEAERFVAKRAARKTRVQPSQQNRSKANPKRVKGNRYTVPSYRQAIERGCEKVNEKRGKEELPPIVVWKPNQLRHSAATAIRKTFGLEAAQVALGHAKGDITQVYAERDAALGRKVAAEIG